MDDHKDGSKKMAENEKLFPDGFNKNEKIENRDKNINEVIGNYNAKKGFFKRIEEIMNMLETLFNSFSGKK